MARKPTDKQLFKMKNEWLGQFYEEVKPRDFYRAVFPEGSFEREGHPEDEKCNGVLTVSVWAFLSSLEQARCLSSTQRTMRTP